MTSEGRSALTVAAIAAVIVALGVAGAMLTLGGSEAQRVVALDPDPVPPAGGPVVTSLGIEASPRPAPGPLSAAVARARLEVHGARQDDLDLGDPRAPITITEYVDLRCAECATVHRDVLPKLIRREVRTGRVHLQLRQLPVLGGRSESLARAAFAAARQNRYWEFVQLVYLRAGSRKSGRSEAPRRLAAGLGLDVRRWQADTRRREWSIRLEAAFSVATAAHLPALPVFLVKAGHGPLTVLVQPTSLADFERAIAISSSPPLASFGPSSNG